MAFSDAHVWGILFRMKTIFLIGTDHKYHVPGSQCQLKDSQAFQRFLKKECIQHGIKTVAEENNKKNVKSNGRRYSIPQRVATALSLKHLFCDPDLCQRAELGISSANYIKDVMRGCPEHLIDSRLRREDSIREKFWLSCVIWLGEAEWPVLFVCGAKHMAGFSKLLEENHFRVEPIDKYWKP